MQTSQASSTTVPAGFPTEVELIEIATVIQVMTSSAAPSVWGSEMTGFKHAGWLAVAMLCTSPVIAGPIPDQIQTFYVSYQPHGSEGAAEFNLYSGPLTLRSVTIAWDGFAGSSYDLPNFGDDDPRTFDVAYNGQVGIFTYSGSVADSVTFSGTSECTDYDCFVGGGAGHTLTLGPAGFVGDGTDVIDCACYINPQFGGSDDSGTSYQVGGTITYSFGAVPEPVNWAMMLGGFGMVGGALRHRRSRASSGETRLPSQVA